jgi:hypothetical protein
MAIRDDRRTVGHTRLGLGVVSACLVLACAAPGARQVDRSTPPTIVKSAGGFTVSRLSAPPEIDGRTWIDPNIIYGPRKVSAPNGRFTLTLEEAKPNEDTGDLAGLRLYFAEAPAKPVEIGPPFTNAVFVTPDWRWFFPLVQFDAIDVVNWRRYSLSESLHIDGFINIAAVSADGRRLFVTTQPCPFDCQNVPNPNPYYEVRLP